MESFSLVPRRSEHSPTKSRGKEGLATQVGSMWSRCWNAGKGDTMGKLFYYITGM